MNRSQHFPTSQEFRALVEYLKEAVPKYFDDKGPITRDNFTQFSHHEDQDGLWLLRAGNIKHQVWLHDGVLQHHPSTLSTFLPVTITNVAVPLAHPTSFEQIANNINRTDQLLEGRQP
jgi:hypothetical protein